LPAQSPSTRVDQEEGLAPRKREDLEAGFEGAWRFGFVAVHEMELDDGMVRAEIHGLCLAPALGMEQSFLCLSARRKHAR
jgi:hypothetical protein